MDDHPNLREAPDRVEIDTNLPKVANRTTSQIDSIPLDFDEVALRTKRLARTREMMRENGLDAVLLFDPYNQRYATGSRNMFGYFLRNSTRYIYIPLEGDVILFEYPGSAHISTWLETIQDSRESKVVFASVNGRDRDVLKPFATEIAALMRQDCGEGNLRVGMDRCSHTLALALEAEGLEVEDCMQMILHTRRIKLPEEVACLALSMSAVETAVWNVEKKIDPGVSENELFAEMYHGVLLGGGEFIETRLLSSGPKTNPWFNEAGARVLRPGDLLALDTDTIGVNGYYADISRTFHCAPGRPSGYQKSLYKMSWEQIQHNASIAKPGMTFREIAEKAWKIPERFYDLRYPSIIHGVGMHGEKPIIAHAADLDRYTGDGVLETGMVISVESYIGEPGGAEGVKLEDQFLVTETGLQPMSDYPFDDSLLTREV
ncbi:M24 family metallopeptidase [Aquicoccus sp. SCR17]|nr:M24 family metallopeptidase [Carideicomes alvinocaridis]